jgi:streptogramin lyase
VWFNGHFSKDPEVLGYVDVGTGEVRTFQIPAHPQAHVTGPIPYGLAVAPDGGIWGSELQGNRIFHFNSETERFSVYPLPSTGALVRHIDVDPRTGDVWAAYGASPGIEPRIARLRIPAGGQ